MKQLKFILPISLALFLLSGCVNNQLSFDPNDTEVKIVDGKSYNIPHGAKPSPYVDAKVIKFYKEIGLSDCKEGDITWEENSAKDDMNVAIINGDKGIYHKLAKEGRIGCSSPLITKK